MICKILFGSTRFYEPGQEGDVGMLILAQISTESLTTIFRGGGGVCFLV